ncbi:MAG: class IV adenylate cyclase [Pirellulales bacterium]|nr:class IV adenylate cyclase [Pirellulales bacterium]
MSTPSDLAPVRRNVELKARLDDLAAARRIACELATQLLGTQRQVDTYFRVAQGRLKLREIDQATGQLIWYSRPDQTAAKTSEYRLVEVCDCAGLRAALAEACGVLVEVDKQREVFLFEQVRIHLDEVRGLGSFLEFEAVLQPDEPIEAGLRQVALLSERFQLTSRQQVAASYSDLLREASRSCQS